MAAAALTGAGEDAKKFKARPPKFEGSRSQWRVFFDQVGTTTVVDGRVITTVEIDGDITVIVNDLSGKTCVQYTYSIGPCT
jgi:uncharacterized cupin superfamily protein